MDPTKQTAQTPTSGPIEKPETHEKNKGPSSFFRTDTVTIAPPAGWTPLEIGSLWNYRELLYFLMWRDIKVRYKQTVVGGAWAVIQPLAGMLVFSLFFGRLAGIPSEGLPYPLFSFCALVPWTYFANAVTLSSNSLIMDERMITKVYFPRVIIPLSAVLSGLLDFAIAFVVLIGMILIYGMTPPAVIWTVPFLVAIAVGTALGVGLWLSALNVRYRDIRHIVPFLVQLWLFATPIAYPSTLVPEPWRAFYGINPMAGVIEGFRWAMIGHGHSPGPIFIVSLLSVMILLISGLYYFRRMEDTFADVV